jgi:hypothetical protein
MVRVIIRMGEEGNTNKIAVGKPENKTDLEI